MDRQTNRRMDGWTDGQPVFDSVTLRYNPCIYSSGIQLYFHTRNSTDFTVLKQFTKFKQFTLYLTLSVSPCAVHFKLPGDTGHFKLSGDTCLALSEASTHVSGCNQMRSVSNLTDIQQEDFNFLLTLLYITNSCENVNGATETLKINESNQEESVIH